MTPSTTPSLGTILFFAIAFLLSAYFTFAAVQGDFGLFRRVEIQAEADLLMADLQRLRDEIAEMENLTHRLSDSYLDLDLLDEQARAVLGLARADEIVIHRIFIPNPLFAPHVGVFHAQFVAGSTLRHIRSRQRRENDLEDCLTLNYLA